MLKQRDNLRRSFWCYRALMLFSALTLSVLSLSAQELTPLLHLKFDETGKNRIIDSLNPDRTIELLPGVEKVQESDFNAVSFDGEKGYIPLGTDYSLKGPTDFSISLWLKVNEIPHKDEQVIMLQKSKHGFNGSYTLILNKQGHISFVVFGSSKLQFRLFADRVVADGKWHHIAAVREKNRGLIYIDGELASSVFSPLVSSLNEKYEVYIGKTPRIATRYFHGLLDEVTIYRNSLSAYAVKEIFNTRGKLLMVDKDLDNDGLTNLQENKLGSSMKISDSDGDSMPDGIEHNYTGSSVKIHNKELQGLPGSMWQRAVSLKENQAMAFYHDKQLVVIDDTPTATPAESGTFFYQPIKTDHAELSLTVDKIPNSHPNAKVCLKFTKSLKNKPVDDTSTIFVDSSGQLGYYITTYKKILLNEIHKTVNFPISLRITAQKGLIKTYYRNSETDNKWMQLSRVAFAADGRSHLGFNCVTSNSVELAAKVSNLQFIEQLPEPTIKLNHLNLDREPEVLILSTIPESRIHYTLGGAVPDKNSPLFTGTLKLQNATEIKAISYKEGYKPSKVTISYFDPDYVTGLTARYYLLERSTSIDLPDFTKIQYHKIKMYMGTFNYASNVTPVAGARHSTNIAMQFDGHIYIPHTGEYKFYLDSDDQSKLYIGNNEVTGHYYIKPPKNVLKIKLKKGLHSFKLQYCNSAAPTGALALYWQGPHTNFQIIPPKYYFSKDSDRDYLADSYEIHEYGNISDSDGTDDIDGDGFSNAIELTLLQTDLSDPLSFPDKNLFLGLSKFFKPQKLFLQKEEKEWLQAHPEIKLYIHHQLPPVHYHTAAGTLQGITQNYLNFINEKLAVTINALPSPAGTDVKKALTGKQIDMIISCVKKDSSQEIIYTKPFLSLPMVVLAQKEHRISSFTDLAGKKIALIERGEVDDAIKKDLENIKLVYFETLDEAVLAVKNSKVDALINCLPAINYSLRKQNIESLQVAATTPYKLNFYFGLHQDWQKLASILNQLVGMIPNEQLQKIQQQYVYFEKPVDWRRVKRYAQIIGAIIISIVATILVWNRRLSHEVTKRIAIQKDLEEAKLIADRANKAKSEFLANISHEIRTPMNSILGFTELLSKKEKEQTKSHYIEIIHNSGRSLLNLINSVLDLSKIESGKLEIIPKPTSIKLIANEMKLLFQHEIAEKGLTMKCTVDQSVPESLLIDQTRLREVLINLLGNAIKFTKAGSIGLSFEAEIPPQTSVVHLTIQVKDTGKGIHPSDQAKVFGAFEQSTDQDHNTYGGTGLGLAISKRIIELMNGSITLESMPEKGTTFTIVINDIIPTTIYNEKGPELPDEPHKIRFNNAKVLIVDDIKYNRELLANYLKGWELNIATAVDGHEGYQAAIEEHPDLILLDMKMPKVDGYETSKLLKENKSTKDIPIIAVTASALRQDEQRITQLCEGYLRKPVSQTGLIIEMAKYLQHSIIDESETQA